jgi:purine nucleoside phosphorylase
MAIGIITGSGTYELPGLRVSGRFEQPTPHGPVEVSRGEWDQIPVLHISRHGQGHVRLSSAVNHRANLWAMRELGAEAIVGATVCGAVDPSLELGQLVVFDDLHFLANRLPDGSLCTYFAGEGEPGRGHWILDGGPFSPDLRRALVGAAAATGLPCRDGGTYGHVDGPRFNTPSEIASLAALGVVAVSQTGGPETVLSGELELPFALLGFITDYANRVRPEQPTPLSTLARLMSASTEAFTKALRAALPAIAGSAPAAAGTMYRIGS